MLSKSSYLRYKDDTKAFATWLINSAEVCGYKFTPRNTGANGAFEKFPTTAPSSLNDKAKKEAKIAAAELDLASPINEPTEADYKLPVIEIVTQARVIARSRNPVIKMPLNLQRGLFRAIETRKRFNKWFFKNKNNDEKSQKKNSAHAIFNQRLEEAMDILKPNFEKEANMPPGRVQDTTAESALINRFAALEVKDVADESVFTLSVTDPIISTSTKEKVSQQKHTKVYELETDPVDELPFVVYCLFEDAMQNRKFIQDTWEKVVSKSDRIAASLVTNIVLELIRKAEDEVLTQLPDRKEDDLVFYPYTRMLTLMNQEHHLEPFAMGATFHSIIKYFATLDIRSNYLPSVLSMADIPQLSPQEYLSILREVSQNSLEKMGQEGTYSASSAAATSLPEETVGIGDTEPSHTVLENSKESPQSENTTEEEDALLCKMLLNLEPDFSLKTKHLLDHPEIAPYEDEITQGLHGVHMRKLLRLSTVFGAQVFLDISKLIRQLNCHSPYEDLMQQAATTFASLGFTRGEHGEVVESKPHNIWKNRSNHQDALAFSRWIWNAIGQLGIPKNKSLWFKDALSCKQHDGINIFCPTDALYAYRQNPLHSDMRSLRMALRMEKIGVDHANKFSSFTILAHIYNTADQMKLLEKQENRWPALEFGMNTYIKEIFSGGKPTQPTQIVSRFFICIGIPVKAFASDGRVSKNWNDCSVHKKLSSLLTISEISQLLALYFKEKGSATDLLVNFDKYRISKLRKSGMTMTRAGLLGQLHDDVCKLQPVFETDLVSLTNDCNEVLRRIRCAFKAKLDTGEDLPRYSCRCKLMGVALKEMALNVKTGDEIIKQIGSQHGIQDKSCRKQLGIFEVQAGDKLKIAAEVIKEYVFGVISKRVPVPPFDALEM